MLDNILCSASRLTYASNEIASRLRAIAVSGEWCETFDLLYVFVDLESRGPFY